MSSGWICVHRKMIQSEIWGASANTLKVWLWCLCRANHEPGEVYGYPLKRGEFVTSTHAGPSEVKLKRSTFVDALKWLETRGMIERRTDQRRTIITVCKYSTYQHAENGVRPKSDQSPTNNRPKSDPNKNQQPTTHTPTPLNPPAESRGDLPLLRKLWVAWTNKLDPDRARSAWIRACEEHDAEAICEAGMAYVMSWAGKQPNQPTLAQWLRKGRYLENRANWKQPSQRDSVEPWEQRRQIAFQAARGDSAKMAELRSKPDDYWKQNGGTK